jgi:hypothetical protein
MIRWHKSEGCTGHTLAEVIRDMEAPHGGELMFATDDEGVSAWWCDDMAVADEPVDLPRNVTQAEWNTLLTWMSAHHRNDEHSTMSPHDWRTHATIGELITKLHEATR